MTNLEKLFDEILLQLNIEKSKYKNSKYVNILLKFLKLLYYQ